MLKPHFALFLLAAACTSSGDDRTATSEIRGDAAYRDAATDHAGNPHAAAAPAQSARLSLVMHGSGQFSPSDLDPKCALDPAGQFQAVFTGTASLGDGSAYLATLASGQGSLTTPSGCQVPEVGSLVVLDAKLRAEIDATTQSCQSYCAASARADAEVQCGATASSADCRAAAETQLAASCTTTCTTHAHVIVAETSLAASLFGGLDLEALRAAALGDLDANLTFDHAEE